MHCMHILERAREIGGGRECERKSERDSQRELCEVMYAYFDV